MTTPSAHRSDAKLECPPRKSSGAMYEIVPPWTLVRAVARVRRQAEIGQHDAPVAHAQQVLRRQVAMDDPGP